MKRKEFARTSVFGLGALFLSPACDKFEYSPYQSVLSDDKYKDNNAKKLALLTGIEGNQSFSFAVIADTHNYYDQYNDCIDHLNRNNEIKFVIHAGDITDRGFEKEYVLNQDILTRLNKPYLCVIGNHEYFEQNGESLFKTIYGPTNFSSVIGGRKFIFFNNNEGDADYVDYSWLDNQINDGQSYKSVFIVTHVPPYSFTYFDIGKKKNEFERIILQSKITGTIFGHEHYYKKDDERRFLQVDYIKKRNYNIVTSHNDGSFSEERVYF